MSLNRMGNWKLDRLSALTRRQMLFRRTLKRFRKKWLRKMPYYFVKHFKDYQY